MRKLHTFLVVFSVFLAPVTLMGESSVVEESRESTSYMDSPSEIFTPSLPLSPPLPSNIRLWEAWAKGYATIYQTDFGYYGPTYTVYNNGPVSIEIDEYIMLMSPSPAYPWEDQPGYDDETQDGSLTITHTISPGSHLIFYYGDYVARGWENPPPWWCTEETEYTNSGVEISLGGEILPYDMISIVENYDQDTQADLYFYMNTNPTLVIGKNPLWTEIDNTGDEVDITLEITNIGFQDAMNVVVTDTIPADYSYDPLSFTHTPSKITPNPDGSTTIEWNIAKIDAAVTTPSDVPTDYTTKYIEYKLITPQLDPDIRVFLPRAYIDKDHDGENDAESEEPLLETYAGNNPPVAIVEDVEIFEGETAYLDGSASYDPDEPYGDSIVSYEWDFDGDGTADKFGPVVSWKYGDNGIFYVTLTVTDEQGASSSATATVTVYNVPPTIDTLLNVTINEGETLTCDGHATDPGSDDLTFTWNWDDGSPDTITIYYNNGLSPDPYPSPEENPMDIIDIVAHYYGDDGVFMVTLTVEDDDGNLTQETFYVFVNDLAPTAEFTWSPKPQFEGSPVQFTDLSTSYPDDIVAWEWEFEGLGTSSDQHPEFTFMDDGVYSVTLTVFDEDNSSDSVSHNVIILDLAPTAEFTWTPEPQNEGSPVQFTDLSTFVLDDIIAWEWEFAGLGTSTDQNPEFTFMDDGVYTVTLTVIDKDNSTDSVSHNVTISDLAPTADFTWSPSPQDEGSPVQFTDTSTSYPDDIVLWEWDFGGLGTSSDQNPEFTFMDDGIYTVTLTVTDDDGSMDTVSYNITILDLSPNANFTWSPSPQFEGSPVQFSDNSTSFPDIIVSWEWYFDDGDTSDLQNPNHTYGDNNVYIVTLTVTDDDGSTDSISYPVTILNVAPDVDAGENQTTDEGTTISFSGSFTDPGWLDTHTFEWDFGDGNTETDTLTPTHAYGDNGLYTVTLTVTDDDDGVGQDTIYVTVYNVAPDVTVWAIIIGHSDRDEGSPVTFDGNFSDPGWLDTHNATWDFGEGTVATGTFDPGQGSVDHFMDHIEHTYGDNGWFTVKLTVEDDDGGIGNDTVTVIINNVAPTIVPLGNYTTDENIAVTLSSTATDLGSDDLTFTWNWGDGTSDTITTYYNDGLSPDPYPSPGGIFPFSATDIVNHTYGDNGNFTVTLTVEDDDGESTVATTTVIVNNVAPTIGPLPGNTSYENQMFSLTGSASDPGSDDITFTWQWSYDTSETVTIYYNNGVSPDPYPSPEINPMNITDIVTHTYGDNGNFTITLTVEDDDGGVAVVTTTVTVHNVAPTIEQMSEYTKDENLEVTLTEEATDPGSDDLIFTWNWGDGTSDTITIYYNDGVGPDPYPSPEINPMNVTDIVSHTYGDNGIFTVTLTVEDDDGDMDIKSTNVTVNNVIPAAVLSGNLIIDENSPYTITADANDPGSDDLILTWDWGDGFSEVITNTYFNDGIGPDPYPSPEINPISITEPQTHTYGDNGVFTVTLTVEDDDGDIRVITTNITVNNVAPTIVNIEAYIYVNFSLRIAGEKWHSVGLYLYENGSVISSAVVTRHPGNPDEQIGTIGAVKIDLSKRYVALVDYLPNDPRENGNVWGANPVWIDMIFEDGSTKRLHHTFNVRQSYWDSDHWNHIDPWEVEISPYLAGYNITLEATATDPGSDDLTFCWDYGDGYSSIPRCYYNNEISPDPYPSPQINPMSCTDKVTYRYNSAGIFCVTLTVEDDDGGICVATISFTMD